MGDQIRSDQSSVVAEKVCMHVINQWWDLSTTLQSNLTKLLPPSPPNLEVKKEEENNAFLECYIKEAN